MNRITGNEERSGVELMAEEKGRGRSFVPSATSISSVSFSKPRMGLESSHLDPHSSLDPTKSTSSTSTGVNLRGGSHWAHLGRDSTVEVSSVGLSTSASNTSLGSWEKLWCQYFAAQAPYPEKFLLPEEHVRECLVHLSQVEEEERAGSSAALSSGLAESTIVVLGDTDSGKTSFLELLAKKPVFRSSSKSEGRERGGGPSTGCKIFSETVRDEVGTEHPLRFVDCAGHEVYQCVHARCWTAAELFVIVWNVSSSSSSMPREKCRGTEDGGTGGGGGPSASASKRGSVQQYVGDILARFPQARFVLVGTHVDQLQAKKELRKTLSVMRDELERFAEKVFPQLALPSSLVAREDDEGRTSGSVGGGGGGVVVGKVVKAGEKEEKEGVVGPRATRPGVPLLEEETLSTALPLILGNFAVSCTMNNEVYQEFPTWRMRKGTIQDYLLLFFFQQVRRVQELRFPLDRSRPSPLHRSLLAFVQELKQRTSTVGANRGPPQLLRASKIVEGVILMKNKRVEPLQKDRIRAEAREGLKYLHDRGTIFWLEQYNPTRTSVSLEEEEEEEKWGLVEQKESEVYFPSPSTRLTHSLPLFFTRASQCSLCTNLRHHCGSGTSGGHATHSSEREGVDCCCHGVLLLHPDMVFHFIYGIFSFFHVLRTPRARRCLIQRPNYSISEAEEQDQLLCRCGYLRFPLALELSASELSKQTGGGSMKNSDIWMYLSFLVELGLGYPVLVPCEEHWMVESEFPLLDSTRTPHTRWTKTGVTSLMNTSGAGKIATLPEQEKKQEKEEMEGGRVGSYRSAGDRKRLLLRLFLPSVSPAFCPASLRKAAPLLFHTGMRQRYLFNLLPRALWFRWQCRLHPYLYLVAKTLPSSETEQEEWEDMILFPNKPPEASEQHNRWADAMWLRLSAIRRVPRSQQNDGKEAESEREATVEVEEEIRGFLYYEGRYPCHVFLCISEPSTSPLTQRLIEVVEEALAPLLKEFHGVRMMATALNSSEPRRGWSGMRGGGGGGGGGEEKTEKHHPPSLLLAGGSSPLSTSCSVGGSVMDVVDPSSGDGLPSLDGSVHSSCRSSGSHDRLPPPRCSRPWGKGEMERIVETLLSDITVTEERIFIHHILELGLPAYEEGIHNAVSSSDQGRKQERNETSTTGVARKGGGEKEEAASPRWSSLAESMNLPSKKSVVFDKLVQVALYQHWAEAKRAKSAP